MTDTITKKGGAYSSTTQKVETLEGMEYKIIRTYSAGVHAGFLKEVEGDTVTLVQSRRLWRWDGAASLSQLAERGTSKPSECKFPCVVSGELRLNKWIEIIDVTKEAKESIESVEIWEE